jgi:DNA-directed RNA polymerase beta subunit
MTIGKLLEILMSSLGLVRGQFVDATPFRAVNARWAIDELLKSGYGAEEIMVDGITGEVMSRPWFIGSCFYQTLKHMVLDKITVRQRGQRAILTRQPLDGRANQGGQRFGEMEKDAFLAHGAAFSLDDRSRIASDAHSALVCSNCGQICDLKEESSLKILAAATQSGSYAQGGVGGTKCMLCKSTDKMVVLPSTYCYTRLLVPEIATCGIKVKHLFGNGADTKIIGDNGQTPKKSTSLYADDEMAEEEDDDEQHEDERDSNSDNEYEQIISSFEKAAL